MSLSKKTNSLASFFLLLIFISMQLVQAMHMHLGASHDKASIKQSTKFCKQSFSKQVSKCHICDYHHHREQSNAPGLLRFSFTCFAVKEIPFAASYAQNIFESSVHTWTNKGPPAQHTV